MTAVMGNCENVIVTNQKKIVEKFAAEFEKLWQNFAPWKLDAVPLTPSDVYGAFIDLRVSAFYFFHILKCLDLCQKFATSSK